jgi:hypothetical protein
MVRNPKIFIAPSSNGIEAEEGESILLMMYLGTGRWVYLYLVWETAKTKVFSYQCPLSLDIRVHHYFHHQRAQLLAPI